MRTIYACSEWTFNVIWFPYWPYMRGQGSYFLWREHPSHLTFCTDLCRERAEEAVRAGKLLTVHQQRCNEWKRTLTQEDTHAYTCIHAHTLSSFKRHVFHPTRVLKAFHFKQWLWALNTICEWGPPLHVVHCCANSPAPGDMSGLSKWSHISDEVAQDEINA